MPFAILSPSKRFWIGSFWSSIMSNTLTRITISFKMLFWRPILSLHSNSIGSSIWRRRICPMIGEKRSKPCLIYRDSLSRPIWWRPTNALSPLLKHSIILNSDLSEPTLKEDSTTMNSKWLLRDWSNNLPCKKSISSSKCKAMLLKGLSISAAALPKWITFKESILTVQWSPNTLKRFSSNSRDSITICSSLKLNLKRIPSKTFMTASKSSQILPNILALALISIIMSLMSNTLMSSIGLPPSKPDLFAWILRSKSSSPKNRATYCSNTSIMPRTLPIWLSRLSRKLMKISSMISWDSCTIIQIFRPSVGNALILRLILITCLNINKTLTKSEDWIIDSFLEMERSRTTLALKKSRKWDQRASLWRSMLLSKRTFSQVQLSRSIFKEETLFLWVIPMLNLPNKCNNNNSSNNSKSRTKVLFTKIKKIKKKKKKRLNQSLRKVVPSIAATCFEREKMLLTLCALQQILNFDIL